MRPGLTVVLHGRTIHWTWDAEKARANRAKHGIAFETAVEVFFDPYSLDRPDAAVEEERWNTLGRAFGRALLFVVHAGPHDDDPPSAHMFGRIISARRATRVEEGIYAAALAARAH